ncbi:sulfatase family protein [Reichenbachiella agariperforans]|uniref:sulfatase family protein n=1 Tax=Reichenbachiella agariperforans TaxID=156994 RepID=UPI001C08A11A|nr:sulfatase [Reichenbachiella agariperforans]MBU2912599.1 sulfatase [Reichenbachiella agariperforans]
MMRYNLGGYYCFWFFSFLILSACGQEHKETTKPNIIFIMSDDHTTQSIGVYGSRLAELNPTPTIDKLASEGVVFDNCYVTNSICTPSRAAILTGQHSQANGVLDLEGDLEIAEQYLPQEMKNLGYQTAIVGKWHLKNEPASFDFYQVLKSQGTYFDPLFRVQGDKPWPNNTIQTTGHSSDVITDATLDWLKSKRDKDKPFFLMHHYKAPHDDFENAPRYEEYLADTFIPEPESLYEMGNHGSEAVRGKNDSLTRIIGSSVSERNLIRTQANNIYPDSSISRAYGNAEDIVAEDLEAWQYDAESKANASKVYQDYLKKYLRCVKGVDDNLARLFAYLEEEGLMENTIIVYTGDQGFMLGEHDYIDKRWMYDESMRMPFIVKYPKSIEAGTRSDAMINNTDFAPTLIEMAGGKTPDYMQGRSFKTILETGDEPADWPQSTYYRYWMHLAHRHQNPAHFGIRTKTQKLIFYYGRYWVDTDDPNAEWNKASWGNDFTRHTPVAWEFYDLKDDPKEMNNRYSDPAYAEEIADLKSQLLTLRGELNEGDENYPHIQKVIDEHWND